MATNGDRKSTGSNFGCTLYFEFFPHSFSQSSSDGTVTSACFAYARCTVLELCPNAWPVLVLRRSVRQIPAREFSRGQRTILLLRGEKAGLRESFSQF